MNILLDTHTFLWWSLDPDKLPQGLLNLLCSPFSRIVLSVVSSWEAQIKVGLEKLKLIDSLKTIIEREIRKNHWEILPVLLHHTWYLEKLVPFHKDPFDRLLIAQAATENLVLATKDPFIISYPQIKTIWDLESL